jgi:hypothetical protein
MRSAIFLGAIFIAKAIDKEVIIPQADFFSALFLIFIIADVIELIKKLTK